MITRIKKRGGLSSIIGIFFFIVIMVAAFGAILTALSLQTDLIEAQGDLSDIHIRKSQEDFSITPKCVGAVPSSTVVVDVKNTGANHVEVVDVFFYDTGNDFLIKNNAGDGAPIVPALDDSLVPPGATVNVLSSLPQTFGDSTYSVKVVTSLGNIRESSIKLPCEAAPTNQILNDELIAQPSVYAGFPNPWNKGSHNGYFSVIIANPTEHQMNVYRVSFQMISHKNPDNFPPGAPTQIFPNDIPAEAAWSADKDILVWERQAGIPVPAYSVQEFMVDVGTSNQVSESPINTINTNAWTDFGQFGSTKIDTVGSYAANHAVPNVFFSSDANPVTPLDGDRFRTITGVNGAREYFVTIENRADSGGTIDANSQLVVNIPDGFTAISALDDALGKSDFDETTVNRNDFEDGSVQLSVPIPAPIAPGAAMTFGFTANAEAVSATTLYIFHTYATGTSTVGASTVLIGPVSENVVQVIP